MEIIFIGTEKGMESRIVPSEGFKIEFIRVAGFKRKISTGLISSFRKMFDGYADAKTIIKRFNPDVVIGMGGYVCGPVLFCASRLKIPTLIHEQNSVPGMTNKILSRFVKTVCISFEESRAFFKKARYISFTGNPIREELATASRKDCRDALGLEVGERLVVVMGGSLGAEKINEAVVEMIKDYYVIPTVIGRFTNQVVGYKLLFSTGESRFESVMANFAEKSNDSAEKKPIPYGVEIRSFIHDVASVYAAADLIVCRAGAITLSELAFMGLPSILIPSPNVTANHQEQNALTFQRHGAAHILLERDLNARSLSEAIDEMLNNQGILTRMAKQSRELAKPEAIKVIIDEIYTLVQNRKYE